ncbi:hypothetical protein [Compostibacter hankyongensis]|uniref:GLPGLI family protein n=1 Tax=Compostibacter hankyongensis TaxID=1007089 RepID=A0ABP8FXJ4_9BACT
MQKIGVLLVFSVLLFPALPVRAQHMLSEGKIVYKVEVELPADAPANAAGMFRGSHFDIAFKPYRTRTDMYLGQRYHYTTIHDTRDSSAVSLIEILQNKYLLRLSSGDVDTLQARYNGVTFRDVSGSRKIAGYICRKAIGQLKDGSIFTVYYTPALSAAQDGFNGQFNGLQGFPLEYEKTTHRGLKMVFTATAVETEPLPASWFDIPDSGYRELSPQEWRSMRQKD